jgi:selenocysteine lyase/cysteine desulfurase
MEHNAVMRPLRALEREGVQLTVVRCAADGTLERADVEAALRPDTRLVILNHASNVTGTILPVAEVGAIARRYGILLLVDAAQTAGQLPIDVTAMNIALLAFSGHKGLLGPTGTGGLLIGPQVAVDDLLPLIRGGTGSRSEFEEQPDFLPDKYESGTLNAVGLAGLSAGLSWVRERGLDAIRAHEMALTRQLLDGLSAIPGVTLYGPGTPVQQVGVISFTLAGWGVSELAFRLDEDFGVLCRPGLHCAPAAHRTISTFPEGTVRLAPGPCTTSEELETGLAAIRRLAEEGL